MLINPEDLRELADPSGARFQRFVTALVLEEALAYGLNQTDIDADYRTNHPDGGCDIFVRIGQNQSNASMIPDKPSVWSIKAGTNGINPSKLGQELKPETHPGLTTHLKDGHVYFWCALEPAGQNDRNEMRDKADKVAKDLGVDPTLIQFVWVDHLCSFLNSHLNLISTHLPTLQSVISPMVTLAQWADESPDKKGLRVPWVQLPGGRDIQEHVKSHLLGNSTDAVFHLAGLSGIGKTRTAIEACTNDAALSDTLYIGVFAQVEKQLWRRLNEPRTRVRLIIDEVPLEQVSSLQDRFADQGDRIRIVSIGPAPRGQARRQRDQMLRQMEPPDEATGVLPVVTAAAPELAEDVRRSIAHFAGHDLRLALLLVDATRRNGQFSTAPLTSYEAVWQRIISLFAAQIHDGNRFKELYELLTVSVDIGHAGEHRAELQLLATHFKTSEGDLDRAIRDASECGLGDRLQNFFEAKPRALAVWLFQERLWPVLSPRLEDFVAAKPSPRLLRRFLERCQETSSPYREEVESRLGAFFLTFLGDPDLKLLLGREASRIFQAWAEFDPMRGLAWLENAVTRASNDGLKQLTGDTDGSGGWAGRRQIVWLCEHLACFAEYFPACERILFRLAQVETEVRIANNSTNTWREMFLPMLANTEVPFPQRLDLLNQRLRAATTDTIDLILSAFYASVERHIMRASPPSIVGGRIVPDQWEPATVQELEECRIGAAKSVLELIPELPDQLRRRAAQSAMEEAAKFLALGVVAELRHAIKPCLDDGSLKRRVLLKLEEWLSWHERQEAGESRPPWFEAVRSWRDELSPATLQERIKDLTARDYWSVYRVSRRRVSEADPAKVYSKLADEILKQPAVVEEISSWLVSSEAVSAPSLLFHLGANDSASKLLPSILSWIHNAHATNLVANYLRGVQHRTSQLPKEAREAIDELAQIRPEDAANITLLADYSKIGLRRLMTMLPNLKADQRPMLRQLSFDSWKEILGIPEKQALLDQLCAWAQAGDPAAANIAMDIVTMWRHGDASNFPVDLIPSLIRLVKLLTVSRSNVDDYHWKETLEAIAQEAPQEATELLAEEITDVESHRFQRRKYAQEIFHALAKNHPDVAMRAIGKWILDKRRGLIFRLFEFRGLFDAIGLPTVRPWVEEHGNVAAIGIARHLDGPHMKGDLPIIPELADWLLSTYSHVPDVFREFAMGRHSGEVRAGHARDREDELMKFLQHFEASPKEWVREWVKYELRTHQRDVAWHDRMDEEDDRL